MTRTQFLVRALLLLGASFGMSWSAGVQAQTPTPAFTDDFPTPRNTEPNPSPPALAPEVAVAQVKLPEGFRAAVFAAEPAVQNPIALAWDPRGRLWVAENYTYAERTQRFDLTLRDRIVIFEDTDGDGKHDIRKVFTDKVQMLTSIEVGHGGVWLMCPSQVLFIPDRNGDDIPDGPAEVKIDGFTVAQDNYHNFANGLRWGPDGWLYGRCGGSCPGRIGIPGTPDNARLAMEGGIWRYHPVRRDLEVLTAGTTNPWGHDWNSRGEMFYVNTVNGQLWHMIPGAHFVRPFLLEPNPHTYEQIDQHADHWHFDTGKSWTDSRDGVANAYGGGHAHCGAMIYLGGRWPESYRDQLLTFNIHGRRANQELLSRQGSGYVGKHGPDFFFSADRWFRGMDLSYGPDGQVVAIDWSDTGECHESNGVHRTSGRVYSILYDKPAPASSQVVDPKVVARGRDPKTLTEADLVAWHKSPNEWYSRQARLVLAERRLAGAPLTTAVRELHDQFTGTGDPVLRLRAMWTLFVLGEWTPETLIALMRDPEESVRAWSIRMLTDTWPIDDPVRPAILSAERSKQRDRECERLLPFLTDLARTTDSGLVRLVLASTLQRLPVAKRPTLALALTARTEDAQDHNLPLMVWYGLIPVGESDPSALVNVARVCQWPKTRRLIARRLGEDLVKRPATVNLLMDWMLSASAPDDSVQLDLLNGIGDALQGIRKAPAPARWSELQTRLAKSQNREVTQRVRDLSVVFGDGRALDEVKRLVIDPLTEISARRAALESLITSRPPDLRAICEPLLKDGRINVLAAQGIALNEDPQSAKLIVNFYRSFRAPERPKVISMLVTRPAFVNELLAAVGRGQIPRGDLSAFHIRQIRTLNNPALNKVVTEVWGELRESPEAKQQAIRERKARLTAKSETPADLSQGRAIFEKTCSTCHKLYGQGGSVGPDLTGANRDNLDYLLENIVDPSAVVGKDFRMTILVVKDGRVLNGLVTSSNDSTVTIQSATEKTVVEQNEIETRQVTNLSPMPEGMLDHFSPEEIRNLFAYLQNPGQVAPPSPAAAPAKP